MTEAPQARIKITDDPDIPEGLTVYKDLQGNYSGYTGPAGLFKIYLKRKETKRLIEEMQSNDRKAN